MTTGHYSVVRCVPDPARGETFNIGIAIWANRYFRVDVDRSGARRAANENPNLAVHSFDNLEETIYSQLRALDPINTTKFNKMRKNHPGTPFFFDEPQFVEIPKIGIDPLGLDKLTAPLQKLMDRLVRRAGQQHARHAAEPEPEPEPEPAIALELERKVRPLIDAGKIARKRMLLGRTSGKDRWIDFLAGTTALDVLRIEPKEEEAFIRDDGEAFKILDLQDYVSEYYVLPFTTRREVQRTFEEDQVNKAIVSVGGKLLHNIEEAEEVMRRAS